MSDYPERVIDGGGTIWLRRADGTYAVISDDDSEGMSPARLGYLYGPLREVTIGRQWKPPPFVPEPTKVGAVVRAQVGAEGPHLFVRVDWRSSGKWYCINAETSFFQDWSDLTGPEVLWEGPG